MQNNKIWYWQFGIHRPCIDFAKINQLALETSVADPGSGVFLTPVSRISDPKRYGIFESLATICWVKSIIILSESAKILFFAF
jgi:hypothetical protein